MNDILKKYFEPRNFITDGADFRAILDDYLVLIARIRDTPLWHVSVWNKKTNYESHCRVQTLSELITALMLFGAVELGLKIKENEKIVDSD